MEPIDETAAEEETGAPPPWEAELVERSARIRQKSKVLVEQIAELAKESREHAKLLQQHGKADAPAKGTAPEADSPVGPSPAVDASAEIRSAVAGQAEWRRKHQQAATERDIALA